MSQLASSAPPGQISDGLVLLSATRQAELVRKREISPVHLVEAVLDQIGALEPHLHAFCFVAADAARAAARDAEAAVMRGDTLGALHGVPVSIKDMICTADMPTVSGSQAYVGFVPEQDDICVARVRAAGGIIIGKTNVAEFGYAGAGRNAVFPTTCNPWDPTKTPGGSSAGSAAAVASGMGSLTIGTDGGGSIRGPASFCGIYGLKPSFGRVPSFPVGRDPRFPGMSSWETVQHLGPLARTVADAALMMSVIAGPDGRDRHSLPAGDVDWCGAPLRPLGKLRIAFTPDFGYSSVDPEVRALTAAAARAFADDLGCELVEDSPRLGDLFDVFLAVIMRDSDLRGMRSLAERGLIDLPALRMVLERTWTAEEFTDAAMQRQRVCGVIAAFMQDYDLLLTPTISTPPFGIDHYNPVATTDDGGTRANPSPFTYPFNWTGQPAASVPAGFTRAGLPVGLQIVGRHLDDALVLSASAAYERVRPWAQAWPPMVQRTGG